MIVQWVPQGENNSPIRNFTIQYQKNNEEWVTVQDYVDNERIDFNVTG